MAEEKPEKKPRRRVKKVKGHGGHHGGAWKVAYADFVTAMMALFLVLWLVSQADSKIKQELARYFRSPGVFVSTGGGILPNSSQVSLEAENLSFKNEGEMLIAIKEVLRNKLDARKNGEELKERVKIEVTRDGLEIQLLDQAKKVSFPSGSSELTTEAREIIGEIAKSVCTLPNPVFIGGHTDKHDFSVNSIYSNWELSTDRANAARRALEAECVKSPQIKRVVGYADSEPLVPDNPYAPANRRISITVLRLANQDSEIKLESIPHQDKNLKNNRSSADSPTTLDKTSDKINLSEKQTAKAKLAAEGAIKVGEDDVVPSSASKTAEPGKRRSQ